MGLVAKNNEDISSELAACIARRRRENDERYGKKQPGEQFVWGPGDVEVTYSPSGKYPPGQYVPTTEEQQQMDREAKRGGDPSRVYFKFSTRKK